jgi:hypothetical protein
MDGQSRLVYHKHFRLVWMDGWTDRGMGRQIYRQMDGWTDKQMNKKRDGWMDGRII